MSQKSGQLRNIWGILKQKVFQNYLQAKTICQIEAQFKLLYQNMDKGLVQSTSGLVHQLLDFAKELGIEKHLKPLFL